MQPTSQFQFSTALYKVFLFLMLLVVCSTHIANAQMDTIYSNNQKIACTVKEVASDGIKYILPGEDVVSTIYKTMVQKVVYKSNRVQTFAESSSYKTINGVSDYNKVSITSFEGEVKGLFKLSDVSSKAKGATAFSSQERVKDRGYRKIKIQAAMFGANIIVLINQRTEGNTFSGYFLNSSTAETNLTGIAYSNTSIDYNAFKRLTGNNTLFTAIKKFELGGSSVNFTEKDVKLSFLITKTVNEGGIILIEGLLNGTPGIFQVASVNNDTFSIAYKSKGNIYNYLIKA